MPIPLGILAAAGFRPPAAAGSYDLLTTTVLTSAVSSVSFTNLNATYGSTYKHLQIRMVTRNSQSATVQGIAIQLNGITANGNYKSHLLEANGSSVYSGAYGESDKIIIGFSSPAANAAANAFGANVVDFLDPFVTTKNKTIRSLGGQSTSQPLINLNSGLFMSTNATTEITVATLGSNFVIGSRFSLYGVKG
jgi:hypothetical protein